MAWRLTLVPDVRSAYKRSEKFGDAVSIGVKSQILHCWCQDKGRFKVRESPDPTEQRHTMGNIETTYDQPQELTTFKVVGKMRMADFYDRLDSYYDGALTPLALWDLTEADLSAINSDQIGGLAEYATQLAEARKDGKTAIVFATMHDFGLGRMLETHLEIAGLPLEIYICRSLDAARNWLGVGGLPTNPLALQCTHHTFILRNNSLEQKYPGGLDGFKNRYRSGSNDRISVHCDANNALHTIRDLEANGLKRGEDYVVIDTDECEMLQIIHSGEVERPFWFEIGADWLRYKNRKGKILVWYDG